MNVLKIKIILLALVSSWSFAAKPVAPKVEVVDAGNQWEDAELSRAFQLAFKGDLTEPALIHRIETKYEKSHSMPIRIFSAYLLTYAPRRVVKQKSGTYIDFVLSQPMSPTVIGQDAVLRLLRTRADESFDSGKFEAAISDYQEILKTAKGFPRDYATLKMGWSFMNMEKPAQAFQIWVRAVEQKVEKKANVSTNLLQGLGQSFAENNARSTADAELLGKIAFDAKQRQFVADGIEDGLDALKNEDSVAQVAKLAARMPWYEDLVQKVFEKSQVSGKRACQYLPWLSEIKDKPLAYSSYGRVFESCSTWVIKSKEKEKPSEDLVRLVKFHADRFEVKASERRFRFELLQFLGEDSRGCQEGLSWLNESADEKARVASPVKEMTELCVKAAAKDEEIRKQLSEQIENSPEKYLSSENDPMVYLATNLMKVAPMRTKMVGQLLRNVKRYRATLLPTLLAERSQTEKDLKSADQLMTAFAPNRISQDPEAKAEDKMAKTTKALPVDPKREAIWKSILGQKIAALLEAKNFAEALPLLDQYAPFEPNPSNLSPEGVRLWTVYLLKAKDDAKLRSSVPSRLERLLTVASIDKSAEAAPVILELGGEFKLWDKVWEVAKNLRAPKTFSKLASEKLWVEMYDAIVAGKLDPKGFERTSDPELKFVAELAKKVKQNELEAALKIKPVGKSPIAQDLNFVKAVEQKRNAALVGRKKKKDLVSEATGWVQFLDRNVKGISKRAFCHPSFSKVAGTVVAEFCKEAKDKIPALAKATSGNREEIEQVISALENRLEECTRGGHS